MLRSGFYCYIFVANCSSQFTRVGEKSGESFPRQLRNCLGHEILWLVILIAHKLVQMHLTELPYELVVEIMTYLQTEHIAQCAATCMRIYKAISSSHVLWQHRASIDWMPNREPTPIALLATVQSEKTCEELNYFLPASNVVGNLGDNCEWQ